MEQRALGRTGRSVSVVGLGTWQLGADWGEVSEGDAFAVLDAAAEAGVTLFDTADVYGDGRSESLIARWRGQNAGWAGTVVTKMGRRVPQLHEHYNAANFRAWLDRSRRNLRVDTIPLVQLHCPPSSVYRDDAVFDALDELVAAEVIAAYGVSVERESEALDAIARPGVQSVQIILNAFRLKPLDRVLPAAAAAGTAIIARVPLASGLLSGRYTESTTFAPDDHRTFNREGAAFDRGETFSGVDYETGVAAAREFAALCPDGVTPAQAALAWVIAQSGVTTVIPGARSPDQARANASAAEVALPADFDAKVAALYDREFRAIIHPQY
ncbi:MAG TPA: aldo/keto reductase [Microbacteriaceae bacterium]|nr:aldo/keto reductase [Microbacteriaceae bacterium]